MKKAWPPTKTEIKRSLLILFGGIALIAVVEFMKQSRQGEEFDLFSILLFGLIGGVGLWLFLHILIFLPLRLIPILTLKTEARGRKDGNATRGALIVRGGLWTYTLIFLGLQALGLYRNEGKNFVVTILLALFFLWMLNGVARGIKGMRDFVGYLMVFGAFYFYRFPELVKGGAYEWLFLIQVTIGFLLGIALLVSKDAGLYLSLQYDKLPSDIREKIEKKKS